MKKYVFLLVASFALVACSEETNKEKTDDPKVELVEQDVKKENSAVNEQQAKQFIEKFYSLLNDKDYEGYAALVEENNLQKYHNVTRQDIVKNWEQKAFNENIESVESLVHIVNKYDENTYYYEVNLKFSNGQTITDYGTALFTDGEWQIDLTSVMEELSIQDAQVPLTDVGTFDMTNGKVLKLASGDHIVNFDFEVNASNGIAFGWVNQSTFLAKTATGETTGNINKEAFRPNTAVNYSLSIKGGMPDEVVINNVYITNNDLPIPGKDPIEIKLPIAMK